MPRRWSTASPTPTSKRRIGKSAIRRSLEGRRQTALDYAGIPASRLNDRQKKLLLDVIAEYVDNMTKYWKPLGEAICTQEYIWFDTDQ